MEGNQLLVTATPTIMALPGMVNYNEYYNTDSTQTMWHLRRDISIGRSQGQMYMTTDGILVFRWGGLKVDGWVLGACCRCGLILCVVCNLGADTAHVCGCVLGGVQGAAWHSMYGRRYGPHLLQPTHNCCPHCCLVLVHHTGCTASACLARQPTASWRTTCVSRTTAM